MITPPHTEWLQAANGTHAPRWRVDILNADGSESLPDVPFIDGQYFIGEDFRADLNVDLPTDAMPALLDQRLLPIGQRVRLSYRIDPWPDWMTVCDLDLVASAIARPENTWTLSASDQTRRISMDDGARGGIDLGSGVYADAITNIIHRTFPGAPVDITGLLTTLPIDVRFEYEQGAGDPWALVQNMALSAGAYCWQDPVTRVFHGRDVPTADLANPVDALAVGEGGQLTGYVVRMQLGYNSVALSWVEDTPQNPTVVTGRWTDTRPDSPVNVSRVGTQVVLGDVFRNVDPLQMPDQATADAAAAVAARNGNARMRECEVRHPVRPWLQPYDVVEVTYLGGPTELQRIRSVGFGLTRDNIAVTRMRSDEYSYTGGTP